MTNCRLGYDRNISPTASRALCRECAGKSRFETAVRVAGSLCILFSQSRTTIGDAKGNPGDFIFVAGVLKNVMLGRPDAHCDGSETLRKAAVRVVSLIEDACGSRSAGCITLQSTFALRQVSIAATSDIPISDRPSIPDFFLIRSE
jgi:hypothetical protein